MKSEFKEFKGRNDFNALTLCYCLTHYAKNYIKEKRINISPEERDAILIIFINYLGYQGGCDLALNTIKGLYGNRTYEERVEPNKLITNLLDHGSYFLFKNNLIEMITKNSHMHNFKGEVNPNNIAKVVVDFINYIAEVNYIERKFSIIELKERFEKWEYNIKLKELKKFLKNSGTYSEQFIKGETLQDIYKNFNEYKEIMKEIYEMRYSKAYYDLVAKKEIDDELYEVVYAYVKDGIPETLHEPQEIQKLKLEMSQK